MICITCGTQFPGTVQPQRCPICEDPRQYVGYNGQQWTDLARLRETHKNRVFALEPGLTGIITEPAFAIGERALLVQTPAGNVLWDCVTLIDDDTVRAVRALGAIGAIAISHPHFYTTHKTWSEAFGRVPVYLHADDRAHVMEPHDAIVFWQGETLALPGGLTAVRCGGHFDGASVLHWPGGADGRGALFTGDTLQVVPDRRYVSFMRSYPNLIPMPARAVQRIVGAVQPYAFDRIYGAFINGVIAQDAKGAVQRSADRYLRALTELV